MIDRIDLNRRIRKVVAHCTGMKAGDVRPANQDVGAIGDQWSTVLILNVDSGVPADHQIANEGVTQVKETLDWHVEVTASIQFFRKDALKMASKLCNRIALSSCLDLMHELGLGYIDAKPVRDLSQTVNTTWEERAQVDISFYFVSTEDEVLDTYDKFPVTISQDSHSQSGEVTAKWQSQSTK